MRFIDTSYSEFYLLKLWFSFLGSKLASLTDVVGRGEAVKASRLGGCGAGREGVNVET